MNIILSVNSIESFILHRLSLFEELKKSHRVQVILPVSQTQIPLTVLRQGEYIPIALSRKGTGLIREFQTLLTYWSIYQKFKPALVHHFTIKPVIYGTLAARLAGVPKIINTITGLGFVFTSESMLARILQPVVLALYRFSLASDAVKVIFQNREDFDYFLKYRIIKPQQGRLIEGSGVDVKRFLPNVKLHSLPRILFGGRLLVEKGIKELIQAAQVLEAQDLQFELYIAGEIDPGNPGSLSAAEVNDWKAISYIKFLGFQREMKPIFSEIDIACLPSYREGVPMFLLEAMACGKPIVTTEAPGCSATVDEGQNGFKVPIKDAARLAAALRLLITDTDLQKKMGKVSRQMAEARFAKEIIVGQIIQTYGIES